MKFKTTIRGYSKTEVDMYLADLEQRQNNLLSAQKQRIDELADENFALRRQVESYAQSERAISQALVDANSFAKQVEGDAQKFAEVTLARAKLFYVTWTAYSKTLIATLTDEEVRRFNSLKDKVEKAINAYEGGDVSSYAATIAHQMDLIDKRDTQPVAPSLHTAATQATAPVAPSRERLVNPITKVEKAAGQTIDLRELIHPDSSLAELCRDLGLNVDDDADK